MSPTKRPSSVAALRRGIGQVRSDDTIGLPENIGIKTERTKPVRVTLNLPPDLFRQLDRWTREAADTIDAPRVGVQDALRAMVRVAIGADHATGYYADLITELRRD
jgi:hypothetical protein